MAVFCLTYASPLGAGGCGIGRAAIGWLVATLFADHPLLHRIQANTRFDNDAMRRALESNKFVLEGRLRQTWRSADWSRYDTVDPAAQNRRVLL